MRVLKKISACVLTLAMTFTLAGVTQPTETEAAIKVLTGKKATISIGETYRIGTLAKGVKYTSSNKNVASVSTKGAVKGKKAGTCKVRLASSNGSASVAFTVTPKKVSGVKASIVSSNDTTANVKVSWKKVKGASGYYVYKSTKKNSGYKVAATIKKGSTTKTTLKNVAGGQTYYYKVKAYAKAGKKKIKSAEYSSAASVKVWKLSWSDEFNGNSLDTNTWQFEIGNGKDGWGNQELENYTAGDNLKVENGNLVIIPRTEINKKTGTKTYTSTRINTQDKKDFKYGKIEIRAKASKGKGTWSAGWMLGSDCKTNTWPYCGEIDILEAMSGGVPQTIHCPYFNNQSWSHGNKNYNTGLTQAQCAADYHTYGIIWNEKSIQFTVDGVNKGLYDPSKYDKSIFAQTWVFDKPFFFILNCAIGGNAAEAPSTDGWTYIGEKNGIETWEDYYYVDYVRVYQ